MLGKACAQLLKKELSFGYCTGQLEGICDGSCVLLLQRPPNQTTVGMPRSNKWGTTKSASYANGGITEGASYAKNEANAEGVHALSMQSL